MSLSCSSDMALKRRSWHVDRVTARVLTAMSPVSSPSFPSSSLARSHSTDATFNNSNELLTHTHTHTERETHILTCTLCNWLMQHSVCVCVCVCVDITGIEGVKEEMEDESVKEKEGKKDEDIVGVYAERLSAVTHAFSLSCHTLQEASGRLVEDLPRGSLSLCLCVCVCVCYSCLLHLLTVQGSCQDFQSLLTSTRLSCRSSWQGQCNP